MDLLLYFKDVFDALLSLKVHTLLKVRTSLSYDVFYLGVIFCYLVMNKFCCNLSSFSFDIEAVLDRLGRLKGIHYTIVHVLLLGLSILGLLQLELEELDLLFHKCHLLACLRAVGQHLLPEIYRGLLIVGDLSEDLGCRRLGVTDQLLREVSQAR